MDEYLENMNVMGIGKEKKRVGKDSVRKSSVNFIF